MYKSKSKLNQLILLNRAPSLHRISIQSFFTKITKKKVIKLHPFTCNAFNADFDGDQMGVHLPISIKAQTEARLLLLTVNNLQSPATGKTITHPSQEVILGCYYLTNESLNLYYLFKKIIRILYL